MNSYFLLYLDIMNDYKARVNQQLDEELILGKKRIPIKTYFSTSFNLFKKIKLKMQTTR